MEVQPKSCLVDTLEGTYRAPVNYYITIIDEDEFIDALFVRLSCPGIPANEIVKLTMDAEVLCLSCADGLWHELKSVFKADHLSNATKHLLAIIHRSGWSMVNLDWEDCLLVLIRDRATAERCEYWQFFDDPRVLYLGSTTSQLATHLAVSRDASSYTYPSSLFARHAILTSNDKPKELAIQPKESAISNTDILNVASKLDCSSKNCTSLYDIDESENDISNSKRSESG